MLLFLLGVMRGYMFGGSMNKPNLKSKGDIILIAVHDDMNKMLDNDKELDERIQKSKATTDTAYKKVKG